MKSINNRIHIATFSDNAVEVIRRKGLGIELDDLCISASLDEDAIEETVGRMKAQIRDAKTHHAVIHGPFTEIIPSAIDHRSVEMAMKRLEEAYAVCEALSIKKMVVHSGFVPMLYFRQWYMEKSVAFWQNYMRDKSADFNIYIENVFEEEPTLMKELVEKINDSRVKLCLDVGHANAMTVSPYRISDWIRVLGPYIGHVHLHNNDGIKDQHNSIMQGIMDMKAVLKSIEENCHDDVTFTVESHACIESIRWLEEQGIIE